MRPLWSDPLLRTTKVSLSHTLRHELDLALLQHFDSSKGHFLRWPVTRWDYLLRQDNDAELWLWFFHIGLLFLSSHLHAVLVDKLEAHLSDDYVLRHVVLVL